MHTSIAFLCREGVVFETKENRPKEHSLEFTYPYDTEEEYVEAEIKWNVQIEALISETSLSVPPHR